MNGKQQTVRIKKIAENFKNICVLAVVNQF